MATERDASSRRRPGAGLPVVVLLASMMAGAAGAPARGDSAPDPDQVLDRLAKAMTATKRPDEKRGLLVDVAKIHTRRAFDLAVGAASDKDVAKEAAAAAAQIAKALLTPKQPAYVRRSVFLRLVACQSPAQAAKTVVDALRTDDPALQAAAVTCIGRPESDALIELVAAQIASFAPAVQTNLIEIFAAGGSAAAESAMARMIRHKDKKVAARAIEVMGKTGGAKVQAAVKAALADSDANVRAAALRALAVRADVSAMGLLLKVAAQGSSPQEKALALRGLAALAGAGKPDEATRAGLLKALNLVTSTPASQRLDDGAVTAAVRIAMALGPTHQRQVRQALENLAARKLSDAARQDVRAALLSFTIVQSTNLARGAKATSPDGHDSDGPRYDAHAIDGKQETYWDETDGHDVYRLRVDLGKATDVSAISIVGWAHHNFSPKDFAIVCDGKTVKTIAGAQYVNNRTIVAFPATRCTVLELKITGCYGGSPAVRELGIFHPK